MSSILPVLRQARSEVMPLVPELAPDLPTLDEYGTVGTDVIQQRLIDAIVSHGVDPAAVSPVDFNKLSRHTMVGSLIGLQRNYLIEGEGNEARFRDPMMPIGYGALSSQKKRFGLELKGLQAEGAMYVRQKHTAGPDAASSWFPALERRYSELGQTGLVITPKSPHRNRFINPYPKLPIPGEGLAIHNALNTNALLSTMELILRFVRQKVKARDARVETAHDIAPLILGGIASSHFYEMTRPKLSRLRGDIVINPKSDRHQLRQTATQRRWLYTHLEDSELPNSRMKCPAHAAVNAGDTNMVQFTHAAINLAAERHDLL